MHGARYCRYLSVFYSILKLNLLSQLFILGGNVNHFASVFSIFNVVSKSFVSRFPIVPRTHENRYLHDRGDRGLM